MNKNFWSNQDFKINKEYWSKKDPVESLVIRNENLLAVNNILNERKIFFFLEGRTLNHVFKNDELDPNDHDDDIGIFHKDKKKLLDSLDIFEENGFKIIRSNDQMISVCRMKRYIDICLFKNSLFNTGYGKKRFPKKHFVKFDTLIFKNTDFNIPHDTNNFLKIRYEE